MARPPQTQHGTLTLLLAPIIALPLLLIEPDTPAIGRTAWVAAVMAAYWATECLPMAVTSLLPIVLFPALGVVEADTISRNYFKDKIVLFFGGLVLACALEVVELHKRIALRVLLLVGTRPPQLLLGFMAATAFISMWMSNTATAAMMMPIAEAVLKQLEDAVRRSSTAALVGADGGGRFESLGKGMVLSIAYAANIGGMATLTGTGPNLVLAGDVTSIYPDAEGLSFAAWLAFGLPLSLLLLLCAWGLLCATMLRGASALYQPAAVRATLQAHYDALGPPTWRESLVFADFALLALLWITREPKVVPGWGALFKHGYVTDGTVAALMACLLFALPSQPPRLPWPLAHAFRSPRAALAIPAEVAMQSFEHLESTTSASSPAEPPAAHVRGVGSARSRGEADSGGADSGGQTAEGRQQTAEADSRDSGGAALLEWKQLQPILPWGVILLLGGGFALADACLRSGLSASVGEHLEGLSALPLPVHGSRTAHPICPVISASPDPTSYLLHAQAPCRRLSCSFY